MKSPSGVRAWLRQFGPGLITGAADDDPSGIATYSQAGAQFGYQLGWTLLLTYPFMVAIQLVSARIGRVTGRGLAANMRSYLPRPALYAIVGMFLVANTINLAADIAAMGEGVRLVIGGPARLYAVIIGCGCLALEVFMSYRRYVRYLKWLTLALLAYVAVVFTVGVQWSEVVRGLVWPSFAMTREALTVVVAILGTTISPYLFFWQAAQEVEDVKADRRAHALKNAPGEAQAQLRRIRMDTWIGMGFSNLIALCIVVSAAATLHNAGITDIQTSAQAAEALRPIAGEFTFLLFALGIVGTGLLAVPVLAGSSAYAVAEAFRWKEGLYLKVYQARRFYAVVAVATLGGLALTFTRIDPIKALFWAAVINGVVSVPIMAVMMRLAGDPKVMGSFTTSPRLRWLGWIGTTMMGVAVVAVFVL
jgi:NRAMP (natural resistance-associated macrophage protein)-like metal ion transporter